MKNAHAFTLIEVLIAMILIGVILISLLATQMQLLHLAKHNLNNTIAHAQLQNFSEQLLIATTDSQKQKYFRAWENENNQLLPNANSDWSIKSDHVCTITLKFNNTAQQENVFCA